MGGVNFMDKLKENIFQDINCVLVGKISKVKTQNKIDVKPLYKPLIDGERVNLPILVNIPLMKLGNDKSIISIESEIGDMVILLISDYDVENLALTGNNEPVNTNSKHQLNDALAIPMSFTPFNMSNSHTSSINIDKNGNVTIKSTGVIKLGENATQGVALGVDLKNWLDSHTHNGGSYPDTSSPDVSTKVVTE